MAFLAIAAIMYVCGFVFLYGVIRIAVRDAIEDADVRRTRAEQALERDRLATRPALPDSAFMAGN